MTTLSPHYQNSHRLDRYIERMQQFDQIKKDKTF